MTRRKRYELPITPPQMVNHGNFIVSLGQLIPILGAEAEKLGVDVFAGFAAAEALFDDSGAVQGRAHRRHGRREERRAGPELRARAPRSTRRSPCSAKAAAAAPPSSSSAASSSTPASPRRPTASASRSCGSCRRGACSPASFSTPSAGRSTAAPTAAAFLYHLDNDRVYVGFVVGLDYEDPRFKPFEAFQQFKNHPADQARCCRAARSSPAARAP